MAARAHFVKKARKDNPVCKKGESYWWWEFPYAGKHYSKEQPKPSQLTQSSYYSQVYALQESLPDRFTDFDSIQSDLDEIRDELQNISDEVQGNLDNMPEGLQQGDTGQMMQDRIDCLDSVISELDSVDIPEEDDDDPETKKDDWKQERLDEIRQSVEDAFAQIE